MRSFVSLFATSVLLASNAFAQGGPPAWAGGPGNGLPPPHAVDPLASNKYWTPSPGPVVPHYNGVGGFWRPFGSQPGQAAPGGPPGGWSGSPQLGPGGNIPGVPPVAPAAPGGGQANAMPGIPGMSGGGPSNPIQGGGESQLKQETDFPGIPTKCTMYTYVPKSFKEGNPIVLLIHHCGGSAPGFFQETSASGWAKMADEKGFILVYPNSPEGSKGCWDCSSQSSLKHGGGGDSETVINMVKYAQKKYGAGDKTYAAGQSSGAMLVQVLSATYPDSLVACAAFSGVPAGCFRTEKAIGADWNNTCTDGTLNEPVEYWTTQAKEMYPAYTGQYPRMLLVHGDQDQIINFNDHREATKQWCGLHGLDPEKPTKKDTIPSLANYEVSEYGSCVKSIRAKGVSHDNPARADLTCDFFGL